MPPLVMPWLARNPSSVCTSTSKIALPIPRTSYLAVVINSVLLRQGRGEKARYKVAAAYHGSPRASKPRARGNTSIQELMIRSFVTVSSGTLASRLLGFVRDAMIAALLGASAAADAFLVAFQLVNVVRRLLSEGALNAALVPAWLNVRDAGGPAAAGAFAGRVFG